MDLLKNQTDRAFKTAMKAFKLSFLASNLPTLLSELDSDIKDHFEMRIQLFFQQLLLSYKTKVVFKKFHTILQSGIKNKKILANLLKHIVELCRV